jgi:outer membrane receptor protein involved in Fe transport
MAQNSGTVQGLVTDPSGAVVAGARVRFSSSIAGADRSTQTDTQGRYRLTSLPLAPFSLRVEATGFNPVEWVGDLRSNVPVIRDVELATAGNAQHVEVVGQPLLDVGSSATHHDFDSELLERMPQAPPNRAMSAVVQLVPGVVPEENGRIHIRGSEAQPQYVLDGVPIADNLSGTFGTEIDTENLRSAQVITGNIPAEYGDKLGGIVNISTKSGLNTPWRGSLALSGGSFDSGALDAEAGGHVGRLGIFVTGDASRSRRFLDPPEIENFRNRGGLAHLFAKFDWLQSETDTVRLTLSTNGSNFQVPNDEESQDEGQRQRQELRDDYQALAWTHTFSPKTLLDAALSRRSSTGKLLDPQETGSPFFLGQHRRQRTEGVRARVSHDWKLGSLQAGGEAYRYVLNERFRLALTDAEEADPEDPISQYTLQDPFLFNQNKTGNRAALFLQNRFRFFDRLSADIGVRFDHYRIVAESNTVSPRIGLAYYVKRTGTVFRAAYNRLSQTPPIENLLLSSSSAAAVLAPTQDPTIPRVVPVEKQNFYEFGVQQQLGKHLRLDLVRYIKNIRNFSDDEQLLTTAIVFPISLAGADIRGTELRLDLVDLHGFTAFASYANARATNTSPITGGLFLSDPDEADSAEVAALLTPGTKTAADQDERNEAQFGVTYVHRRSGFWGTFGGRFDSGLPTEFDDDDYPTFDPRIQRALDPVRKRLKPRTILNLVAGVDLFRETSHPVSLQAGVNNLTDRFYLYNFRSAFSGTHIGRPREIVGRVVFTWQQKH